MKRLRIGSRRSELARAQAARVADDLCRVIPDLEIEWVYITTTGDRIRDRQLSEVGGKGLFLKEIEAALLAGEIDLAIHSGKDIPAKSDPALQVVATPPRASALDVWCGCDLPSGSGRGLRIGTGSTRRGIQLRRRFPEAEIMPIRGNVGTRLAFVERGELDAVVLAAAGLSRLGDPWHGGRTELDWMLPACAQGTLALQVRADDTTHREICEAVHDPETWRDFSAERIIQAAVGGDCFLPFGVYARREHENPDRVRVEAALWSADASREVRVSGDAPADGAADLAAVLGAQLVRDGAGVR